MKKTTTDKLPKNVWQIEVKHHIREGKNFLTQVVWAIFALGGELQVAKLYKQQVFYTNFLNIGIAVDTAHHSNILKYIKSYTIKTIQNTPGQ